MIKKILSLLFVLCTLAAPARTVYPLSEEWRFQFGHENNADRARYVSLPHTWNGDALAGVYPYLRTQGLYFRSLYAPQEWTGKRLFLRFGGVESTADIFVNGNYVASHRGAGVAFTVEITDHLIRGRRNELMVAVSNVPRGDVMPTATERNHYGGISRQVELLVTDPIAISPLYHGSEGLFILTDMVEPERAEGRAILHLSVPTPQAVAITLKAYDASGKCCAEQRRTLKSNYDYSRPIEIPFAILNPKPWSPEEPSLYRFTATVSGGENYDQVEVTTGLRCLSLTAGGGLRINGRRVDLRALSPAYDHPACASLMGPEEIDADLELLEEVGANALFSPAGPHAPYLYSACDKRGLLARIDLPFTRTAYLSDLNYYSSPEFEEQGVELLRAIIAQHMNNPSVVIWGLFTDLKINDPKLLAYLKRLNAVAHEMDPTRPTLATSNQDGEINFITDAIAWHQQLGWERGRGEDLSLWIGTMAEKWSHLSSAIHYSAEGFIHQQPDSYEKPAPYTLELPERRQSRFHELYMAQLSKDSTSLLWGHWVDGLSDYGSARRDEGINGSGLVSFDRRTRKDAFYLFRARWNAKKMTLHIADKRWVERPAQPQQLHIYASETADSVWMTINNDTMQLVRVAPNLYFSEEFMPQRENHVVVRMGQMKDEMFFRCGSELKEPQPQAPLRIAGPGWIN